jgi:hypothetical protein
MAALIKLKRGTSDPSSLVAGEPAFNTSANKLFVHNGTTEKWVGAEIEASPGDWTSATKLPTQSAVNTTFMPKAGGTFSGDVSFSGGSDIRFIETGGGTDYVAFQAPASIAASVTWTLPSADGGSGQVLSTNGTGTLSWADASSATTVTTTSDNTDTTRYLVFSSSAQSGATLYVDDTTGPLSYNPSTALLTNSGNLAVNGGDITTTDTTANIFTSNATSVYIATAATDVRIGSTDSSGTARIYGTINTPGGNLEGAATQNVYTTSTTLNIGLSSTNTSTTNIVTGNLGAGNTKTINIGTGATNGIVTVNLGSSGAISSTVAVGGNLTVSGGLVVNGTTTTINSTTLTVDDKNIEMGSVSSPDNDTADGGGITLKGGAGNDKTIIWDKTNTNWTSSENWNLASGKVFKINNTEVLSGTTLGSGVTSSSLTTVGTIATGVWAATDVALAHGGTNASLSAVNGGIVYSTASAMAITAAGTSGQVLTSAGAASPTWTNQSSLAVGSATTATTATNVVATEQTTGTMYLVGVASASSSTGILVDATATTPLSYNVATGVLAAAQVDATIDGGTY